MKLTIQRCVATAFWLAMCVAWMDAGVSAQGFTTTTVQGTVYLANGRPGSGSLQLSWPAFTTASNQAVTAGRLNVNIGADGYVSVKVAPNLGSMPAGLYYTAVYHLSDGTTSTEYWVVPAAAQANLSQVRAQVMPAAQAVQAVSKGYVDQSIAELTQSLLTASGGSLSGPLFLNGDPTQPTQAATKRYVDNEFAQALPASGGVASGPLTSVQLGAAYQVDQFPGVDFGAKLQACLNRLDAVYGGTCDGRNFTGSQAAGSTIVVSTANATVQLPCATIATANPIRITAGTRNVTMRGCALRGASDASGSQGGTVLLYSGSGPLIQVGDPTYAVNTLGFHLDNMVINTTASSDATAEGLAAYRTQELDLEGLYLLGNSNQTGITLDGTGNYSGGTFQDIQLSGFATALNAVGHQAANAAPTDWVNASTFVRLHINCPTDGGSPRSETYGINLLQGDGNTFTGGDVEGCGTALHLGPNAQNNTIIGLRNENSINQIVADAGSSYNNWITGGTMFTGQLTDNGTRNSFLDTFHRSFNGLNGDWYGSQKDATITNHYRIGTGMGTERGLLNRYQTDYGYRWTTGLSDASAGEQFYQVLDELNNVYRLSIGQYNHGQSSTNNQTVINAAGTGAVVLNGSANAGTGGVIFGAGGSTGAAVATINSAGNAQFNGSLQVGGPSTFTSSATVKNQADAEIDSILWAGSTANQKESYIYKDYTGASQWYMVKDASNNWALNSAVGGLDSFKAYQSNNSGDTYINASNGTGHIRLNFEPGSGAETDIYAGSSSSLVAAFLGASAIKFPGLAPATGRNCLQIDNSGYISNTGSPCGTGGSLNGTVSTGNAGEVAYYAGNGTVIAGTASVGITAGGTGATSAAQALQNLGAQPVLTGVTSDGASGVKVAGNIAAGSSILSSLPLLDIRHPLFAGGAVCDGSSDIGPALQAAWDSLPVSGGEIQIVGSPKACYWANPTIFNWGSKNGPVTLLIQGELQVGSTLTFPSGTSVNLIGKSGTPGQVASFQGPGESAWILARPKSNIPVKGTLGTEVTATGVATTFTPSSMNSLYPGTAITVAGALTCSISSVARSNNIVKATFSSACHIPPGVGVTVQGVADSSFNGTYSNSDPIPHPFMEIASDYVANTLTWNQPGADAASSAGTITGLNEDSIENVQIIATTSTTATAVFARPHNATEQFGMVGLNIFQHSGPPKLIRDITVTADGTMIWLQQDYLTRLQNVGASAVQACNGNLTNFPIELGDASFITMDGVAFNAGCLPWGMRLTQPANQGYTGSGPVYLENSFIMSGIKLDHGGSGIFMKNTVIEQATRGAVVIDPTNYWNGNQQVINIENSGVQDNPNGIASCFVYYETPVYAGLARANVSLKQMGSSSCMVNDYFSGAISTEFPNSPAAFNSGTAQGVRGVYNDGITIEAEVRGEQAGLSPVVIPYPTLPVTTSPASWPTSSCSVSTGVLAPDGTTTAAALTKASGAGTTSIYTYNVTPAVGDRVLYGGWVHSSTPGMTANAGGQAFLLDNFGSSHFLFNTGQQNSTTIYDSQIVDDWWHPIVGVATVTSADGTAGSIRFNLSCQSDRTMNFWQPFMVYVKASDNIPLREVMRWRSQLFHGYVPAGAAAGDAYSGYPLNLPGDPTSNNEAATKHYVDAHPPTYTLPPASAATLGGVKCDGVTTTCDADGTVRASLSGTGSLTTAGGQTLTAADTVSGLPSGCMQLPCVMAKGIQTSLNSATDLNLYTSGVTGTYRVSSYGYVKTAGTTGAVMTLCLSWNDGYTSAGNTCPVNNSSATALNRYSYSQMLHLAAGQTIHTYNNCSSGAVCNVDWVVERLQ